MLADYAFNPLWVFLLWLLLWVGLPAYLIYRCLRAISRARSRRRFLSLPQKLAQKVTTFPECSFGEYRVTLILSDARKVPEVIVASGAIKEIADRSVFRTADLDFDLKDIVDVCHTNQALQATAAKPRG